MKMFKRVVALAACACLALSMGACQTTESSSSQSSDIELMQQAKTNEPDVSAPFYVLVVGNDSRTGTVEITNESYADGTGRSDTMMLVRIDPANYGVTLITVPRDTAATYNGSTIKINEAYHQGGIDSAIQQVQQLTGVEPKYYFDMSFVDFAKFVDDLGGLTASVPIDLQLKDILTGDKIRLAAGPQDLNGAEALVLARSRKQYADDLDACRQIQDRQLVEVAIRKVAEDPANAAVHAQALIDNSKTNWPVEDLLSMVADFAAHAEKITISSGTGPYEGGIDENAGGQWLAVRDEATWKKVIAAAEEGSDLNAIVPLPEVAAA